MNFHLKMITCETVAYFPMSRDFIYPDFSTFIDI